MHQVSGMSKSARFRHASHSDFSNSVELLSIYLYDTHYEKNEKKPGTPCKYPT